MSRTLPRLLLTAYAVLLGVLLLWPQSDLPDRGVEIATTLARDLGLDPRLATLRRVEVVANVLVTVPAALLARLGWPVGRWWHWALGGLCLAVSVEAVQAVLLPQRSPSVVDVVANTLGVVAGAVLAGLAASVRDYRGPRPRCTPTDRPTT